MSKVIDFVAPTALAESELADHLFGAYTEQLRAAAPLSLEVEINVVSVSETLMSRRRWPQVAAGFAAVVVRRYDGDETPAPLADNIVRIPWSFSVAEHIGIDRPGAGAALKSVSLLCGAVDQNEFRTRYRHHVELVVSHMPVTWRYVQNDVAAAAGEGASAIVAISELWYRSQEELDTRYLEGAAGAADFASHEGFLDLGRSISLLCRRSAVGPSGRQEAGP
jgi:hypothetical protein